MNVIPGGESTLRVVATGLGSLSYQWLKDGQPIPGATSARLWLESSTAQDAGTYRVQVSDEVDSVTSEAVNLWVSDLAAFWSILGPGYRSGRGTKVNVRISSTGDPSSLSFSVIPPDAVDGQSWTLVSTSDSAADSSPLPGTTDLWEWQWSGGGTSGDLSLSFVIQAPENASGPQEFVGSLTRVDSDVPSNQVARPDPLTVGESSVYHTADTNANARLELSELLRVIELYNTRKGSARTGRYKASAAAAAALDGFAIDGSRSAEEAPTFLRFHNADVNRDAMIGLSELLRVIELYNTRSGSSRTGAYRPSFESEDGFAPGPES
jgi:hypothetical protein